MATKSKRPYYEPSDKQKLQRKLWMLSGWTSSNISRLRFQEEELRRLPNVSPKLRAAAIEVLSWQGIVFRELRKYTQELPPSQTTHKKAKGK